MTERTSTRIRGIHRVSPPSSALRGRVVVAAVAVGAFAAAAAGQTLKAGQSPDVTPLADSKDASAAIGIGGDASAAAPEILTVAKVSAAPQESQKILASDKIVQARAEKLAAEAAERNRPRYVQPAQGRLTSGFGARWGTTHYGLDIANRIGTPIVAVADGTVIEAGPASGFGLWVRIQHADGTISVYGHMDTFSVHEGEQVRAGEQIARMGSRGYSTGPHLHFEIWDPSGMKVNPRPWLAEHGITF
ncbi:M23 family metallopeptidase [Actinophytocola sp.]|jgi:murein DD-endopeptidase MepM/ murein hydrolase activator NlpD|uniref:M23 family metallopeptidase n=1 Tax=Actinophytocola sp. TaxID=1872138 RepID=UPI002EDADCF7